MLGSQLASRVWVMVPTIATGGSVAVYERMPLFTVSVADRSVAAAACSEVFTLAGCRPCVVLSLQARPRRRAQKLAARAAPGSTRHENLLFVFMGFGRSRGKRVGYSLTDWNSVRRFFWRPSAVALVSMGLSGP